MFFYATFVACHLASDQRLLFDHAVFSISSQVTAPNARMLKAYSIQVQQHVTHIRMTFCRVLSPDDYQEFLKMGVSNFKIEKEPTTARKPS
jgi:hypothetical protein